MKAAGGQAMRRFVVDLLDFLCLAAIVLATIVGFSTGFAATRTFEYGVLYALASFVAASVVMGAVLAITEIAKNTRRLITLMETAEAQRR